MNYYMHQSGKLWQTELPKDTPISIALGCFDGVHLGHQALLREVISGGQDTVSAIWTFAEPLTVPYIEKVEDRIKLCSGYGIKYAICETFERFRQMSPSEFVSYLYKSLNVRRIVCGEDFKFGKDKSGDVSTLKEECEKLGIEVKVVQSVYTELNGQRVKVSSTLIRSLIADGNVASASRLLGRPFAISGVVVNGNNLGRTIQVPTLNQRLEKCRIVPKNGVYNTVCAVRGEKYPSITNVGTRPTVVAGSHEKNCETHIIDEKLDLYGEIVSIEFYEYVRDERKFDSLADLREQITKDIESSVAFFDKYRAKK